MTGFAFKVGYATPAERCAEFAIIQAAPLGTRSVGGLSGRLRACNRAQLGEFHDGTRPNLVEIEIWIELSHEPNGHTIVPECEHPERLPWANYVVERIGDLVGEEKSLLRVLLIRNPSLLEGTGIDGPKL